MQSLQLFEFLLMAMGILYTYMYDIMCPSLHPKSHYACVFAEVCRLGSLILCLNRVLLSFNKIALIAC